MVKCGNNFFTYRLGLICRFLNRPTEVFQHHHELVAAQSRHGIALAHAGGQTLCDLLQQQVANIMAKRIVEVFEMIQIDEQQRTILNIAGTSVVLSKYSN